MALTMEDPASPQDSWQQTWYLAVGDQVYVRHSAQMNACFWSVVMLIAILCLAVPLCALLPSLR